MTLFTLLHPNVPLLGPDDDELLPEARLNLTSLRGNVQTGLTDDALEFLYDEALQQVESRFGTDAERTIRVYPANQFIRLPRPALSITSVAEFNEFRYPLYTLTTVDYELHWSGRILERLFGNYTIYTDRSWAPVVDVTYLPRPEQVIRDRVVIDLVKLAVQYNALEQENVGGRTGYITMSLNYQKERERLLAAVPMSRGFQFA